MKILLYELKRYLYDWKKMTLGLAACCLITVVALSLVYVLSNKESLIEPFTIGVVSADDSMEINLLLNMFNSHEGVQTVVSAALLSEQEAESLIAKNEIAALLYVPEGFVDSIKTGANIPFTFVSNNSSPLSATLAKILTNAGLSFLSVSQSGIYATIDFAYENGLSYDEIQSKLILPINLAYIQALLNYDDYIATEFLNKAGDIPTAHFYGVLFISFLILILFLTTIGCLQQGFQQNIWNRLKWSGYGSGKQFFLHYTALFLVGLFITSPLIYFIGLEWLLVTLVFTAYVYMAALWLQDESTCGFFIIFSAGIMLFCSGGIIPIYYLPQSFTAIRKWNFLYWIVQNATGQKYLFILVFTVVFLLAAWLRVKTALERIQ